MYDTLILLASRPFYAQIQAGQAAGLLSGLTHPMSGLDYVLAMIAVGLWGAQLRAPAVWLLPVTFPMTMAVGGYLARTGMPMPGVEVGIALSALLLGLMVAREARPPLMLAAALVGCLGMFHGHAHGSDLPTGQSGVMYGLGFVAATGYLHGVGVAVGVVQQWPAGRTVLRVAGASVALAGAVFVWQAVT